MASLELLLIFTLISGVIAYLVGKVHPKTGSILTIIVSGIVFASLAYFGLNEQLLTKVSYLPYISFIQTPLAIFFGVLVSFVFFMVSFFNPYFIDKYTYKAVYSLLYLLSLAGIIGIFFTDNFMTLFFFFELVVWSSLFLIPLGRDEEVSVWYFGFSVFGSFALLSAILLMQSVTGTFDITTGLQAVSGFNRLSVFILLLIAAFAKLGAFPLHYWLPKVLTDSPDPVTSIFSGGLEKLGAFIAVLGLVKLVPTGFFIDVMDMYLTHYILAILGSLTIIGGTVMAIRQDDAKKLLAYSSMSNGGYIIVALSLGSSAGISGGLYHIIAHAIASTAAFLAIGAVARQTNTTKMSELGGMLHKMPITYMVYLIAIISMAGIPPMGGFISKWLIFQGVINKGLILVAAATFFGSIGSFLYVFRPLAALFLGQELPQFKETIKEAPIVMLIPMVILSLLNIVTGVYPTNILAYINTLLVDLNIVQLDITRWTIVGTNGTLNPALIAVMFALGVFIAFIIFISLKKSRKVELMDTYTAANFIYTEELLHYSVDFYAPIERLYEPYIHFMKKFYQALANKVREVGALVKYYIFTSKPEVATFFIMLVIAILLWGDLV
ncbi:MAG: NADH-quinone oxidoreductase subunit M [Candidatus Izimaplasma sp.]|nr:NADH-quinone oxidoreductase subunit M [Candidatus Izimaplasma bacterium]